MSAPIDDALVEALRSWAGSQVAVRVVAEAEDELIGVFAGRLGAESDEEHPALFWPLESEGRDAAGVERRGLYIHPALYERGRVHEGGFVVEFAQAGVVTNVRLLGGGGSYFGS